MNINKRTNKQTNKQNIHINIIILTVIFALSSIFGVIPLDADEYAGKKASLWRDNSKFNRMYADARARAINDIVTIRISETSTATNKAELTTSKKTSISMGIDNFLGLENEGTKLNSDFSNSNMIGASTDNSNQGEGESTRESTLSAYISARVIDVLPNGNLVIEAKKEVMVNKEKEIAVLTGIIRTQDISYDNIVPSNKIADMQIQFSGKGPVSAQTKRGWLSWLIGVIWPF